MAATTLRFHPKFEPVLREAWRYKSIRGGRGGGKSYQVAVALVLRATEKRTHVLCARQFQNSLDESVYSLIERVVVELGLAAEWEMQKSHIVCKNGSRFSFIGLERNIASIKSYEGVDICWVEEAQAVKEYAWRLLLPTIRKTGSEVWLTWNPDLETDPTYRRFVATKPKDCLDVVLNLDDNLSPSPVLYAEREETRRLDPESYASIWEGECRTATEGAVYGRQLIEATDAGRIHASIPYNKSVPVVCGWDLGHRDKTAIWFCQLVGYETRLIDYLEGTGREIHWYLQQLRAKPYLYGIQYLPHDATHAALNGGGSIEERVRAAGFEVEIVPAMELSPQLDKVRSCFHLLHFSNDNCEDGVTSLRHYAYEVKKSKDGTFLSRAPKHDQHSHAADALRYLVIGTQGIETRPESNWYSPPAHEARSWMAA